MRLFIRASLAAAIAIGTVSCGAPQPASYSKAADLMVEEKTPIQVQSDEMDSVTFGRTIIDIPAGSTVGRLYVDGRLAKVVPLKNSELSSGGPLWTRIGFTELRSAGYPVLGQENLLFNQDDSGKSRYVLGGTITDSLWVVHGVYGQALDDSTPIECGMTVRWQVFDTNTRSVVLTKIVRGYQDTTGVNQAINGSFKSSLRNLLADSEFVSSIRKKVDGFSTNAPPAGPRIDLNNPGDGELKLPDQMQKVTDAVVTVRVGNIHGSGFFITKDGYLLTAAHVVSKRDTCLVLLGDGRQAEARVWKIDEAHDVALLRVAEDNYPALALASSVPPLGTEVYAIGTPLREELERSVSKGIVSAVRNTEGLDAIQTDAAVNRGNSGGPLVDKTGKVVGIVSAKVAVPGYSGIGFAVPIQSAVYRLQLNFVSPPTTQP